ncbi:MAG: hypothetical protein ACJ8H8_23430, partial [Geminicoccaceae bacterium]
MRWAGIIACRVTGAIWVGGALLIFAALPAGAVEVNTGYFGGVAIKGYDTVAYFTDGRPMKGSEEFAYNWLGTPWYFAS